MRTASQEKISGICSLSLCQPKKKHAFASLCFVMHYYYYYYHYWLLCKSQTARDFLYLHSNGPFSSSIFFCNNTTTAALFLIAAHKRQKVDWQIHLLVLLRLLFQFWKEKKPWDDPVGGSCLRFFLARLTRESNWIPPMTHDEQGRTRHFKSIVDIGEVFGTHRRPCQQPTLQGRTATFPLFFCGTHFRKRILTVGLIYK